MDDEAGTGLAAFREAREKGIRVSIRAHKDIRSESTVVGPLRMEAGPVTALLQRESSEHGV